MTTITIHQAVELHLQWLMTLSDPAKAVVGFINDCMGWQRRYGLPIGAEKRACKFIDQVESGLVSGEILEESATLIITQLAYIREGARERQMESPDEPVNETMKWWKKTVPGWAFV